MFLYVLKLVIAITFATATMSSAYSMDAGVARGEPVAPIYIESTWRDMFPGVEPSAMPGGAWIINPILQQIQNP